LTSSIETLIEQVHPQRVKQRQRERWQGFVEEKRRLAWTKIDNAKAQFVDVQGRWRTDRLALIGGSVGGVIALVVSLRAIAARRRRAVPARKKPAVRGRK